jgi:ATP-dependent 26S proteasome regulatory subunit
MQLRIEVMCRDREAGQSFLAELTAHADRLNVYRGHVISLSPNQFGMGPQTLIAFHSLPLVTRDDVVLPDGLLERIERHTIVFGEHAERLRAQNRSLKRGLLLYGPPGTGKTWTVMYLAGRLRGRTVILASGRGMGMFQQVAQVARKLAPSMVVLEDVDLIAEDRGNPFRQPGPVLFELLNEMDGLRDDTDVIFVLTTNRPEVLEPALAARPGRVDLVVEFPMPDAHSRLRILQLYSSGVDIRDVDLESIAERTAGASPAYLKELLRKATLLAAADNSPHVTRAHFERASEELSEGGRLIQQVLGFQANPA